MRVVLGLGGNLGDPPKTFQMALSVLSESHRVLLVSRLYRTEPEGPAQPRFWNMAALIHATTPLLDLLDESLRIEAAAQRSREPGQRWQPRTLDVDLLIAEGLVHRGPQLILPHPRLHRRAFALVPAAELVPDWLHPLYQRTLGDLAREAELANPGAICTRRSQPLRT